MFEPGVCKLAYSFFYSLLADKENIARLRRLISSEITEFRLQSRGFGKKYTWVNNILGNVRKNTLIP